MYKVENGKKNFRDVHENVLCCKKKKKSWIRKMYGFSGTTREINVQIDDPKLPC